MANSSEAQMEGYLQKRFKSGVVKTLKKKWYVLNAGEIRCYQSKDAYQRNEIYLECLLVSNVQTVRPASENHGVEVVTQPKTYILVASNAEEQQRWVKAIYEAMKDNRPRSTSCPVEPTDKQLAKRKRLSTGPKAMSRILPGFNRRSTSESQFYVNPQPQQTTSAEIGVQANLPHKPKCEKVEESEETPADNVFETQTTADTTEVREVAVAKSVEGDGSTEFGQENNPCSDSEPRLEYSEISGDHVLSTSDAREIEQEASLDTVEHEYDTKQENGMHELELMLRNASISSNTDDEGGDDSDAFCDNDDDDDEDDDDDDDDDDNETLTKKTQDGKSAFDQLQELLQNV